MRPAALPLPLSWPIGLLDRARHACLRALGPLSRPLVRSRELRVAVAGTSAAVFALVLTGVAPLWMLALGPLFLGVPHVASDVRYLVTRPGLQRRPALWIAIGVPLALTTWTLDARWGLAAMVGAAATARARSIGRRVAALGAAALALALAWQHEYVAAVVMAHAHNFVAIGLWLAWRRRRSWLHLVPVAAFVLGTGAILGGALDALLAATGGLEAAPGGQDLWLQMGSLAPGVPEPWGARLVLLFAFSQSVHYAIWIRLVPEEDRARETPRTFQASLLAWADDSGWTSIVGSVVVAIALLAWATIDLAGARDAYLYGVIFHGYLELAVGVLLFAEGRGLRTATT